MWEMLLRNFIKKGSSFYKKIEIVNLENEVVIYEIVFGMVHG
jgi:hypothetical protein